MMVSVHIKYIFDILSDVWIFFSAWLIQKLYKISIAVQFLMLNENIMFMYMLFYYIHKIKVKPLNLVMSTFFRYNPRPFSEPDQISSIYKIPHNIKVILFFFSLSQLTRLFRPIYANIKDTEYYGSYQLHIKICFFFLLFLKKEDNLRNQKPWNKESRNKEK